MPDPSDTNPSERTTGEPAANEQPLASRAVRGGLWVVLSSYWMVGFGFAINIVLTRLLDPEVFGIFVLALFYTQLLRLHNKLGIGYAFVNHKEVTGESLGTYVVLDLLAITLGVVLGVAVPLLAEPVLTALLVSQGNTPAEATAVIQVSIVLAFAVGLQGLWGTGYMLLEKGLYFRQVSLLQSICVPLSYVPTITLALNGFGVWSLVAQVFTQYILFIIGMFWLLRRYMSHIWGMRWQFRPELARHFVRFGFTVGLGVLATLLLTQLDDFFIGTFAGLTALGFYDRAYRMAKWPSTLLGTFIARTAFQTYARVQDDPPRLQKTAALVLWLITGLSLPLALAIFIAAPDMLALLYGERWLPATIFLRILVVFSFIQPLWENAGQLFVAIGKPRLTASLMWSQVATLALLGLPSTLMWGALGTCGAVAVAFGVGLLLIQRHMQQEVALNMVQVLAVPLLLSGLTLTGYLLLDHLTGLNDLPLLIRCVLKGCYAYTAFFGLLILVQPRQTRERVSYIWRLATQRTI